MRLIFTGLLPFVAITLLSAQITLTADYLPDDGDTLFISVADSLATVDLVGTDGPLVWDFSSLNAVATDERLVEATVTGTIDDQFPDADLKVATSPFSTNYYRRTNTTFELVGNLGVTDFIPGFEVATPFEPAYVERRAPLAFGDQQQTTSSFLVAADVDSLPAEILALGGPTLAAFDSIRLNTQITRTDMVDAYGTLTVDGATYDVLRERREETREIKIEAKLGFLPWADVTSQIVALLPEIGDAVTEQSGVITYEFWSNDHVEPIATVNTNPEDGAVRSVTFKTNRITSSINDIAVDPNQVRLYPNPAVSAVVFEAEGLQRGQYTLRITNMLGRKMANRVLESGGSIRTELDVSQLPRGLYLYSLINSRGRILATKRLLVGGRP